MVPEAMPVAPEPLDLIGCQGILAFARVDAAVAQDMLPDGFEPGREAPVALDRGLLAVETIRCGDEFLGRAYIPVRRPEGMGADDGDHQFIIDAWATPGLAEALQAHGLAVADAEFDWDFAAAPGSRPFARAAYDVEADVAGVTEDHGAFPLFWYQQTDDGIVEVTGREHFPADVPARAWWAAPAGSPFSGHDPLPLAEAGWLYETADFTGIRAT